MKSLLEFKKTPEELGRILYDETFHITDLYFKSSKERTMNKQLWAYLHMGFIAGLKVSGYTEEEVGQVLEIAQDHIAKHDERYNEGRKTL